MPQASAFPSLGSLVGKTTPSLTWDENEKTASMSLHTLSTELGYSKCTRNVSCCYIHSVIKRMHQGDQKRTHQEVLKQWQLMRGLSTLRKEVTATGLGEAAHIYYWQSGWYSVGSLHRKAH